MPRFSGESEINKTVFKDEIIIDDCNYGAKGFGRGEYDSQAILYDKLISNGLYNKIMWGNSPKEYAAFCKKGLKGANGIIADIGCGTLGFTVKVYAENKTKNLFLCGLSLEMLKIGKRRLGSKSKGISSITFLRSDALNMPLKDAIVQTALSFGVFHIFENPTRLIKEIVRILKPGSQLFLSSLYTDRKLSKKYLEFLNKKDTLPNLLNRLKS